MDDDVNTDNSCIIITMITTIMKMSIRMNSFIMLRMAIMMTIIAILTITLITSHINTSITKKRNTIKRVPVIYI